MEGRGGGTLEERGARQDADCGGWKVLSEQSQWEGVTA